MNDPDFIWQGDQCIPPWDSRNILPEWERLSATLYDHKVIFTLGKTIRQQAGDPGLVSVTEFAQWKRISAALFFRTVHRSGIAPAKKIKNCLLYKLEELEDLLTQIMETPDDAVVTGLEAALILRIDRDALDDIIRHSKIPRITNHSQTYLHMKYVLCDLKNAIERRHDAEAKVSIAEA